MPGFPIQRSPDQRLFDNSPELIAAYHVFHRLWTPRHPPCTLTSLTTLMYRCRRPDGRRRTRRPGLDLTPPTTTINQPTRRQRSLPGRRNANRSPHREQPEFEISNLVMVLTYPLYSIVKDRPAPSRKPTRHASSRVPIEPCSPRPELETPLGVSASLEPTGFEPATPGLQSQCSPN